MSFELRITERRHNPSDEPGRAFEHWMKVKDACVLPQKGGREIGNSAGVLRADRLCP
jgi:hypothetical protein